MIKSADSPKKLLASKKSHRFLEFLIHTKLFFFLKLNSSSKQNYVFFPVFAWLEVSNLSEFPQSNSQHRTYIRTYTPTHLHTLPTDLHPYINTYIHTYIHTSVHPYSTTPPPHHRRGTVLWLTHDHGRGGRGLERWTI